MPSARLISLPPFPHFLRVASAGPASASFLDTQPHPTLSRGRHPFSAPSSAGTARSRTHTPSIPETTSPLAIASSSNETQTSPCYNELLLERQVHLNRPPFPHRARRAMSCCQQSPHPLLCPLLVACGTPCARDIQPALKVEGEKVSCERTGTTDKRAHQIALATGGSSPSAGRRTK